MKMTKGRKCPLALFQVVSQVTRLQMIDISLNLQSYLVRILKMGEGNSKKR